MPALFSVKDKIILISGGAGILGTAISKYLAGEGAIIGILDRTASRATALVSEIEALGGRAFSLITDVTDEKQLS